MITFLSLFLGLVTGPYQVQVAVGEPVAAVELRLDGRQIGIDREEPWEIACDFGEALRPHRLTAVALDADGEEVGRVDQWINLPRSRAEAGLVIEERDGGARAARLVWESMEHDRTSSVAVTLDGERLAAGADGTYPLPPFDERLPHVLRADLVFPGNERSHAERVIGGDYGEGVNVAMTAVPVIFGGRSEPSVSSLQGAILTDAKPAKLFAVERGPLEMVVVLEQGAISSLGGHGRLLDRSPDYARTGIELEEGDAVRFMSTTPTRVASGSLPYDLFPISTPFTSEHGELPYILTHVDLGSQETGQRIADAVATAGVQAAAGNRRRLVLLILGHRWEDESQLSVAAAKQYLASLGVPLVVWSTGAAQSRTVSDDRIPIVMKTEWGKARNVGSVTRLLESTRRLLEVLSDQRIVWVEGDHLPTAMHLAKGAKGIEAGSLDRQGDSRAQRLVGERRAGRGAPTGGRPPGPESGTPRARGRRGSDEERLSRARAAGRRESPDRRPGRWSERSP